MSRWRPFPSWWRVVWAATAGLLLGMSVAGAVAKDDKEKPPVWMRVNTGHFSVLTDASADKAQETALRFEQMREVFAEMLARTNVRLSHPIEILAFRSSDEYQQATPPAEFSQPGFFLAGKDRNYIVLNLGEEESWQAIEFPLARYLINYNYPPAQDWFDEGLAAYFTSLRAVPRAKNRNKDLQIGGDPEGLSKLLTSGAWIPVAKLLAMKGDDDRVARSLPKTTFCAESWMVVHYLLSQNQLADAGRYFELVKNENVPIDAAVHQAFGMSAQELDQKLREYAASPPVPKALNLALDAGTVGYGREDIPLAAAQALIMEMVSRVPEHRDAAIASLNSIASQPKLDNPVVHRALGWDLLQQKKFPEAEQEFLYAMRVGQSDTWTRMEMSITKYEAAQASNKFVGVANMMLDLQAVLDWYPDFAEAYNLLGLARLEGGGTKSAGEAMHSAIMLSPRNEQYLLNLARIDMAGKKWDEATALLERLRGSENAGIAQSAKQQLSDLPTLKKYGLLPQKNADLNQQAAVWSSNTTAEEKEEDAGEKPPDSASADTGPDKRPVKFMKGKLLGVDCSQSPVATVMVLAGGKKQRFVTHDYKSLPVIGADEFSCDWKDKTISVNYKAAAAGGGDLVSVEVE
jgi:tetratricopeptide (TPR) repeat protein